MTYLLYNICRDHSYKNQTHPKKRHCCTSHITLAHPISTCCGGAERAPRETTVFTAFPRHAQWALLHSLLYNTVYHPRVVALRPPYPGEELICCVRTAAWYLFFLLKTYSCINSSIFLFSSPTYCYLLLLFCVAFFLNCQYSSIVLLLSSTGSRGSSRWEIRVIGTM